MDDSDSLALRPIELDLEPVVPSSYLGRPGTAAAKGPKLPTLSDRVEFGGPSVVPIDSKYCPGDSKLQAFLNAHAGSFRFVLAEMSVNFPFGKPPLATASVEVDLEDDDATAETFAYSILPTNLTSPKDATKGFELQPNATILGTGGTIGGASWSTTVHGSQAYMIGGPELSPHPAWMFRRTSAQEIEGSTRLVMVVQVPDDCTGSLTVSLQASVHKTGLRFVKREIPLPGADAANPAVVRF